MKAKAWTIITAVVASITAFGLSGCGLRTDIHSAARRGDLATVKYFVQQADIGIAINAKDSAGNTPLHVAAECGQLQVARFLIASYADLSKRNRNGQTALQLASTSGHRVIADLIRCQLVSDAAEKGNKAALLAWLKGGFNPNYVAADGDRPIHYSLRSNDPAVIALLVAYGADVNVRALNGGATPLIRSAMTDHASMVYKLLSCGARVGLTDSWGRTALHCAAENTRTPAVMKILLAHSASASAKDRRGLTPLHHLASNRSASVPVLRTMLKALLSKGGDLHAVDHEGNTLLHQAIYANSAAAVQVLVGAGAPIRMRNKAGESPLSLATRLQCKDLVRLMTAHRSKTPP